VFSFGYDFHAGNGTAGTGTDNGNIWNLYHFRDRTRDQSFDYDQLNRLISAQNAGTDCTAHVLNNNLKFWATRTATMPGAISTTRAGLQRLAPVNC
jgi:hypothetical protein